MVVCYGLKANIYNVELQMVKTLTKESAFSCRIAETMNVDPGHTFGACLQPEDYGKYMTFLLDKLTHAH